ncbi:MAG: RsmB/NOP family class I SAM-dependent RNA methyltransferase, partial [Vicinamibacterales bacterium]
LDPEVLTILRLSVYQLLHLTRVPAAAIVDDAVQLTRRAGKSSASGLTNAVLRNISRRRGSLALPARPDDTSDREAALAYLSVTLSHPRWLAARWLDRVGLERAESWMRFNNQPAPVTLRLNSLRATREPLLEHLAGRDVAVRPGAWAPDALVVTEGDALADRTDEGSFVVQDEASQLVALLAGSRPGPRVLDACASPGGKTTAFAAASPASSIVACDVRTRRMSLLAATIAGTGATNVRLVQADLLKPLPFAPVFDVVVVDAPCSGLGTLRRDPDIRWRRMASELPAFARAQRLMLGHAAAVVRPGGRLVYATCSSEPEENEDVVRAFLADAARFHPLDARLAHGALSAALVDGSGCLRTEPDRHGLEMFFGAVFGHKHE